MSEDKKQAALEMAKEELENPVENTDINSKYGEAPDLTPKEDQVDLQDLQDDE